jgi:hypothetical protein
MACCQLPVTGAATYEPKLVHAIAKDAALPAAVKGFTAASRFNRYIPNTKFPAQFCRLFPSFHAQLS